MSPPQSIIFLYGSLRRFRHSSACATRAWCSASDCSGVVILTSSTCTVQDRARCDRATTKVARGGAQRCSETQIEIAHLVELMLAEQPARVLAVGARFGAEAGGVADLIVKEQGVGELANGCMAP
eukprot:scaffold51553_cov30-Tisochrysis_lutea.AAC.6